MTSKRKTAPTKKTTAKKASTKKSTAKKSSTRKKVSSKKAASQKSSVTSDTPPPSDAKLDPNALTPHDLAGLLSRFTTTPITPAMINADLDAGAPAKDDGTLSLVHYAAWLLAEACDAD